MPDSRLVARVRAGDERAFEVVFDRYHRQLLAFCRHMLGTREEAEDALQHAFVSAHRSLVEDGGKVVELRPWLYAIARNRCLSILRARREAVALEDVPEPTGEGLAVAAEVEQREDLKAVLGDLARLPDDQRAALVLSELGALSHDEVAQVLGVRRDKVKALVFQARESLAGWRQARDTDCRDIREQLATLSGGALRRAPLRRHLDTCDGCRQFRTEVRRQREAMALLLPVIPSIALKAKIVGAIAGGHAGSIAGVGAGTVGAAAVAESTGGGIAALGTGLAGKALVVAAIAGTAGGGYAVVREERTPSVKPAPVERVFTPSSTTPAVAPAAAAAISLTDAARDAAAAKPGPSTGKAKGKAKAKANGLDKPKGRPDVPGANGLAHAPESQGLAHRANPTPGSGRGQGKPQAGTTGRSTAPGQVKRQGSATSDGASRGRSQAHRQDSRPAPRQTAPAADDSIPAVDTAAQPTKPVKPEKAHATPEPEAAPTP